MKTTYQNTNENLYTDIALWEQIDGVKFVKQMPLEENTQPRILDFGFGFGEYLFAAAYAYPKGQIVGIDGNAVCYHEVLEKVNHRELKNVTLIKEHVNDLSQFKDQEFDLVFLYDTLHASYANKKMLLEEAHRVLKKGGCLSVLPFHQGNWRDKEEKKKKYSVPKIKEEIVEFGYQYVGSCEEPGVHWEKCHTLYYIQKRCITFDLLERMSVLNFIRID